MKSRVIEQIEAVDEREWEALDHADNPFVSLGFLRALESSGAVGEHSGWQPRHLAVYQDGQLAAFAPSYLKSHSHGEFVFDWAWADAYHRHQLDYYPKLLTAVPWSPVSGPRLLVRRGHAQPELLRKALIDLAFAQVESIGLSSWHCNFTVPDELPALGASGMLPRSDWQFHWINDSFEDFDDFLSTLRSRKRKNIRRERRLIGEGGLEFQWKAGGDLAPEDIEYIYRCYCATFDAHGNHPALPRVFFGLIARELGDSLRVVFALRDKRPAAMGLFLTGGGRLYGRYWGCTEQIAGLHFETAYYQGIDFCIRQGLRVFESGAQGEHKISRGFVPVRTYSFHLISHPAFRNAISEFLERESRWQDEYKAQLLKHLPFRKDAA
jgi:predicted N-acyltransferase